MSGFTKLDAGLIHSTVWREADHVRLVWITMLAMCDKDGFVQASIPGLADASRVDLPRCEDALKVLQSPDEYSRTSDNEGRRIEKVDGGWYVLNYPKYRSNHATKNAERQRKWREKQAQKKENEADDVTLRNVTDRYETSPSASASASDNASKDKVPPKKPRGKPKQEPLIDTIPAEVYRLAETHRDLLLAISPTHTCGGKGWKRQQWATVYDEFTRTGARDGIPCERVVAVLRWALDPSSTDDYWYGRLNTAGDVKRRWDTLSGQMEQGQRQARRPPPDSGAHRMRPDPE